MTDYKKAFEKAVDYIMNSAEDYCPLCVNFKPCNNQLEEYGKAGADREPDRRLCKQGLMQYFVNQSKNDNGEVKKNANG